MKVPRCPIVNCAVEMELDEESMREVMAKVSTLTESEMQELELWHNFGRQEVHALLLPVGLAGPYRNDFVELEVEVQV